jgi:hypothetical protein
MNDNWNLSILFYEKERGFLFGKNRQGKYDIAMEKVWESDIEMIDVLVRLIVREYALYESYYFQRRCKKMVKDSYGVDVLKEMLNEMKEKYKNGNAWYQYEYVYMESVFKEILFEWMKDYANMEFDIEMENGCMNRIMIFDISNLSFQNDKNGIGGIHKTYGNIDKKYKYGIMEYDWVKWEDIEWEKNTEMLNQVIDFMNVGIDL